MTSIGAVSTEADTIPPGTKINLSNWQRYQQFMTEGTKLIFAGDHFWSVPKNAEITVGPTIPIGGRPKLYIDYTEKYGSRAKLVRSDTGDYFPATTSPALPDPTSGDPELIGEKVHWDAYYRPQARTEFAPGSQSCVPPSDSPRRLRPVAAQSPLPREQRG